MRAWQFTNTHEPLVLADVPVPVAGPGQVVLDVVSAGLCHSDVGVLEDEGWLPFLPRRPVTMGHEVAGVIAEVGEGVTEWSVGDRVGVCPMTRAGAPGYGYDGGFADKILVDQITLVAIPDNVPFALGAAGTDAGMTSHHAVMTKGRVVPGTKLGIIGLGGLGQIGARVGRAGRRRGLRGRDRRGRVGSRRRARPRRHRPIDPRLRGQAARRDRRLRRIRHHHRRGHRDGALRRPRGAGRHGQARGDDLDEGPHHQGVRARRCPGWDQRRHRRRVRTLRQRTAGAALHRDRLRRHPRRSGSPRPRPGEGPARRTHQRRSRRRAGEHRSPPQPSEPACRIRSRPAKMVV